MHQKINPNILLLLLGGSGQRFKSRIPKQFISLSSDKHPLFIRTLSSISQFINFQQIVLVVNPEFLDKKEFHVPLQEYRSLYPDHSIDTISGAQSRHASFLNGARYILSQNETGNIVVHDANRPFISHEFASRILIQLQQLDALHSCYIPVAPVTDSICQIENYQVTSYLPREKVMAIQTPQLLHIPSLRNAIYVKESQTIQKDFTDEGSFMMSMGFPVYVYPGDPANKKITYNEDMT